MLDMFMLLCDYAFMRTTLDLPEELFREVKIKAAMEGVSLKRLLTAYVEKGLRQGPTEGGEPRKRSPLPVIRRRGKSVIPNLTPEMQANLQHEEDLANLNQTFGR